MSETKNDIVLPVPQLEDQDGPGQTKCDAVGRDHRQVCPQNPINQPQSDPNTKSQEC